MLLATLAILSLATTASADRQLGQMMKYRYYVSLRSWVRSTILDTRTISPLTSATRVCGSRKVTKEREKEREREKDTTTTMRQLHPTLRPIMHPILRPTLRLIMRPILRPILRQLLRIVLQLVARKLAPTTGTVESVLPAFLF